ncbi:MAG: hypothetical protein HYV33_06535 [Candidatus Kerfeldbacteria bacterium]|nr:hypothetical protein [Candidatus Kerfeldbacteria bacterium]
MSESENKLFELQQAIEHATAQLNKARQILSSVQASDLNPPVVQRAQQFARVEVEGNVQVVEGVFNGQNMVGPDGKIYTIPANYVSKSKLVEGDLLKLTIQPDGSFIYKQIGPVERKRLVGKLIRNPETGDFSVLVGQRNYRVIKAAITYFKGEAGDEVVLLVPQAADSSWAAVENIIHDTTLPGTMTDLLTSGVEAELPSGDAAELPTGAEAELPSA